MAETTRPPDAELVETLKKFVWTDCTDSEIRFALSVCQALGLNPLLKHVVVIRSRNGPTLYTTRDGLLHLAHQSGQFNGMQSGVIYREAGERQIEGAWCMVYRKDMSVPFRVEVDFKEYFRPQSPVWQQYPAAMIKKVAEHMALKLAFDVSGLASVEEVGLDAAENTLQTLLNEIKHFQTAHGLSKEQMRQISGRETLRGLNVPELADVIGRLKAAPLPPPATGQIEPTAQHSSPTPGVESR